VRVLQRHKWMVMAGAASALVGPLAERAVEAAWRGAAGEDPPKDVDGPDVDWGRALAWTVASAVVVAVAKVVARRGARVVWEQLTGAHPPRSRARRKRLALR
jgi:hypothetical protein